MAKEGKSAVKALDWLPEPDDAGVRYLALRDHIKEVSLNRQL